MTRHAAQPTINKDEEIMRELRESGQPQDLKRAQRIAEKDPQALDQLIADEDEALEIEAADKSEQDGFDDDEGDAEDDAERGEPGDREELIPDDANLGVLGEDDEGPETK